MTNRGTITAVLERGSKINLEVEVDGGSGVLARGPQIVRVRNTPENAAAFRLGRKVYLDLKLS